MCNHNLNRLTVRVLLVPVLEKKYLKSLGISSPMFNAVTTVLKNDDFPTPTPPHTVTFTFLMCSCMNSGSSLKRSSNFSKS